MSTRIILASLNEYTTRGVLKLATWHTGSVVIQYVPSAMTYRSERSCDTCIHVLVCMYACVCTVCVCAHATVTVQQL